MASLPCLNDSDKQRPSHHAKSFSHNPCQPSLCQPALNTRNWFTLCHHLAINFHTTTVWLTHPTRSRNPVFLDYLMEFKNANHHAFPKVSEIQSLPFKQKWRHPGPLPPLLLCASVAVDCNCLLHLFFFPSFWSMILKNQKSKLSRDWNKNKKQKQNKQ